MAEKLYRTVISWLGAPFQPHVLPLTMVLMVLMSLLMVDAFAWFMVIDKVQ